MGGSSSKSADKDHDKGNNSQVTHPVTINDTSEGFHIIELHMPSVGGTFLLMLLLAVALIVGFYVYRRHTRRFQRRRRDAEAHLEMGPMPPIARPFYFPSPSLTQYSSRFQEIDDFDCCSGLPAPRRSESAAASALGAAQPVATGRDADVSRTQDRAVV